MHLAVLRIIHNRNLIVDKNTSFLTVKNVPLLYSSFLRVIGRSILHKNIFLLFSSFLGQNDGGILQISQKIHNCRVRVSGYKISPHISVHFLAESCRLHENLSKKFRRSCSYDGFLMSHHIITSNVLLYIF